jgi:hypothetical protein
VRAQDGPAGVLDAELAGAAVSELVVLPQATAHRATTLRPMAVPCRFMLL